jgi:outer membrane protein assembly factor BamB
MWRRGIILAVLVLAALAISACSSGRAAALAGSSWPGVSGNGDTAYVAYQTGVHAIDLASCQQNECEETWIYSAVSSRRSLIGGQQPVQFFAEPAFDDDIVVVGDYSDAVHAIDAETGEQLWVFSTARPRSIFGITIGSTGARFISGAIIDGGTVYVGAADGNLYALDAGDGELQWSFHADSAIWDAPLLDDGVLYVPSLDQRLYAIDAGDGDPLWQFEADGALVGTPTLDDGVLYFGSFDRRVYAISAEDGRERWSQEAGDWVWDSPAVANGLLVVGDLSGNVYGLNSNSGSIAWETQAEGPVVGTPVIQDDTAYFGSGDAIVYAVDVETGRQRWQTTIQTEFSSRFLVFNTGTSVREVPIYGSLVPYEDTLLVGLQQGDNLVQALNTDSGNVAWSLVPDAAASTTASSSAQDEETEQQTPTQQLIRWLPLYLLMTLLMIMLLRRRQSE